MSSTSFYEPVGIGVHPKPTGFRFAQSRPVFRAKSDNKMPHEAQRGLAVRRYHPPWVTPAERRGGRERPFRVLRRLLD